jgi:hypothetical protein
MPEHARPTGRPTARPLAAARSRARSRLAADGGFVLPASMAILMVITLLGAAAVATSVSTSNSTMRDERSKAALEVAEAGLRVGTYRLNVVGPASEECMAGSTLVSKPSSEATQCLSPEEGVGNSGSYKYWTSIELKKGGGCVGIIMTDEELERLKSEGVAQRCITSVGTVNGVTARVQARVSSFTARPVFPIAAMIARERLIMEGNSSLKGAVASNGKISSQGSASQEGGCILGPSGSFEGIKSTCEAVSQRTPEEGRFVVGAIQPGTSAKGSETEECKEQAEPLYNCNFLIQNGIVNAEAGKEVKKPADGISSTGNGKVQVEYESKYREMSMNTGSWTLNGYLYNFCNFNATGNSTISVNPGIKAVIFIDSPEDPESKCPAGSGKFEFSGTVNNPSGDPTALQIYVYGKGPVTYNGNVNTSLVLDAPNATVKLTGNATITGGIIGNEITTSGSFGFIWSKEVEKLKAGKAGATTSYYRTAWAQCASSYSASTPTSGC